MKQCSDCPFTINVKKEVYKSINNKCPKCGAILLPMKISSIKDLDIKERVVNSINKWFGELGIEGTLEMLEKQNSMPYIELFKEEINKKGLKLKGIK